MKNLKEQLVTEELKRRPCKEAALGTPAKRDSAKVALAARLRAAATKTVARIDYSFSVAIHSCLRHNAEMKKGPQSLFLTPFRAEFLDQGGAVTRDFPAEADFDVDARLTVD